MVELTLAAVTALDAADPLAALREHFHLPDDLIYLDGNSLGPPPKATVTRLAQVVEREWGAGLVRSWNSAGWIDLPRRVGDKIAQLIGAPPGTVIVADSTSVNLFKVLAAALRLRPERRVIVSERDNFPTDLYMAQGLIDLLGGQHELRLVDTAEAIPAALAADTAVLLLTEVNYRTGRLHDMAALTAQTHACGALTIWDLAHSAGALPVDLTAAQADFAVGCGYKYLNGGPGAPAFVYVAPHHQADFRQPLAGWMGHAQPFAFDWRYEPAPGVARYLCGTQPVLSMSALECGVDLLLACDLHTVRAKSLAMTELFIALVESLCPELRLATPRAPNARGSQVSFQHPQGYPIMQALIARGVIGDFRAPDILRFGFTPLYLRYVDVWHAAQQLAAVLTDSEWQRPEFSQRAKVT
jgi:kynureninase